MNVKDGSSDHGALGTYVAAGPTMVALPPPLSLPPGGRGGSGNATSDGPSALPPPLRSPRLDDAAAPAQRPPGVDPSSSPRLSSSWDSDFHSPCCSACRVHFSPVLRRHHCRLCGKIFCHDCSSTRSLIPPSALVLKTNASNLDGGGPSFSPGHDGGDSSVTYVGGSEGGDDTLLLHGRGLEQRVLLARHPQRTCHPCRERLAPLQEELRNRNSNAVRYNYIDEGNAVRRLCNSPLAFTLGHEVRKAAYALGNLLPGSPGRTRGPCARGDARDDGGHPPAPCFFPRRTLDPTLRNVDKIHIPAKLMRRARGLAIVTAAKGGFGFAGFEFGTGLVVARRGGDAVDDWSAPSAIGIAGVAWGALVGAQVSDHVFLLMTDEAVRLFSSEKGRSIQLGADVGVAVGPLGRSAEADIGATSGASPSLNNDYDRSGIAMAPIYTYSLSKGLYAGVSLDGRMLVTRDRVNEKFYGRAVSAHELLSGQMATPPAAQPLYDALKRCRVYSSDVNEEISDHGGPYPAIGDHGGMGNGYADHHLASSRRGDSSGGDRGGFMERLSHTTGAGLPVINSRYYSPNPYNLSGRDSHTGYELGHG